jgi:hypothetical protein
MDVSLGPIITKGMKNYVYEPIIVIYLVISQGDQIGQIFTWLFLIGSFLWQKWPNDVGNGKLMFSFWQKRVGLCMYILGDFFTNLVTLDLLLFT